MLDKGYMTAYVRRQQTERLHQQMPIEPMPTYGYRVPLWQWGLMGLIAGAFAVWCMS